MLVKASHNVYGLFLLCFYVSLSLSIVCKGLHAFLLSLCYFDCLFDHPVGHFKLPQCINSAI